MSKKIVLAAALALSTTATAHAGGLLDESIDQPPAPPMITLPDDVDTGSLPGGLIPILIGAGIIAAALSSGGGS